MPIIHNSWEADEQPPIITKIMQACGALAVKSEVASDFLTEVWNSASEYLSDELVSPILVDEHRISDKSCHRAKTLRSHAILQR